jgi:hypothetical protein
MIQIIRPISLTLSWAGESKFRELTDYLHNNGFRLMIHTTGWGIDPYHPDIDALQKLVVRKGGQFTG